MNNGASKYKGDIVRAVLTKFDITEDKEYEVLAVVNDRLIKIKNDKGIIKEYCHVYFDKIYDSTEPIGTSVGDVFRVLIKDSWYLPKDSYWQCFAIDIDGNRSYRPFDIETMKTDKNAIGVGFSVNELKDLVDRGVVGVMRVKQEVTLYL